MQNMTKEQLLTYFKRFPGICSASVQFATNYDTLLDAWNACTRPGWMAALVKRVFSLLTTPQEKIDIDIALTSLEINYRNNEEDVDKAAALRAALPNLFT